MDRGIRLAVVMAAVVSLIAGLAWDRVMNALVAGDVDESGVDANETGDGDDAPRMTMEFHYISAGRGQGGTASLPTATDGLTHQRPSAGLHHRPGTPLRPMLGDLPDNPPAATNPASAATLESAAPRERLYTVVSGDRLGSISREFFGSERYWREIMRYNGMTDPKALFPGQVIKIPPIDADERR